METQFTSITQKGELIDRLRKGDDSAISYVINEIDRLESVIKNYELSFSQAAKVYYGNSFKQPKNF